MKQKILMTLLLIAASLNCQQLFAADKTIDIQGVTYRLSVSKIWNSTFYSAYVTDISGYTEQTLTFPTYVYENSTGYEVELTAGSYQSPKQGYHENSVIKKINFGNITSLETISGYYLFNCPNLTDIYFNKLPYFYAPSSEVTINNEYFRNIENIRVHLNPNCVTEEELAQLQYTAVWSLFNSIDTDMSGLDEEEPEPEPINVNVYLSVEAAGIPQTQFLQPEDIMVQLGYAAEEDHIEVNGNNSGTIAYDHVTRLHIEMSPTDDSRYGYAWELKHLYVNGKDVVEDVEEDMTMYYDLDGVMTDTYVRAVFEPQCVFVRVMSMGQDVVWTRYDGESMLIDCAEGDNYYVPVVYGSDGVVLRTDLIGNKTCDDYNVYYWKNNGMYDVGQSTMAQGGVEVTSDNKNFQFMLFPEVTEQDRIINVVAKPDDSGSGSGTSTDQYDLNGDGAVNVSDIDKLIERINQQ
ncbi:MAG: hypothetical protein K6C10_10415 [Prevotella sp.]|nr:hypothetical protein [Prevotella sp.]